MRRHACYSHPYSASLTSSSFKFSWLNTCLFLNHSFIHRRLLFSLAPTLNAKYLNLPFYNSFWRSVSPRSHYTTEWRLNYLPTCAILIEPYLLAGTCSVKLYWGHGKKSHGSTPSTTPELLSHPLSSHSVHMLATSALGWLITGQTGIHKQCNVRIICKPKLNYVFDCTILCTWSQFLQTSRVSTTSDTVCTFKTERNFPVKFLLWAEQGSFSIIGDIYFGRGR
jgi:hypothetical protein